MQEDAFPAIRNTFERSSLSENAFRRPFPRNFYAMGVSWSVVYGNAKESQHNGLLIQVKIEEELTNILIAMLGNTIRNFEKQLNQCHDANGDLFEI